MITSDLKETKDFVIDVFQYFQKSTLISDTIIIDMRSGTLLQSPLK